jgi:hypothetical protein
MTIFKVSQEDKNVVISISIPPYQKKFILTHKSFNPSKFFQNHLNEYIQLQYDVEKVEKEVNKNVKEATIE